MIKPSTSNAWLIGAAIFFLILAKGLDTYFDDARLIQKQHRTIQDYLQEQELAVEQLLESEGFVDFYYNKERQAEDAENRTKNYFQDIVYPFNICLYKNHEQIVWSNRIAFPDQEILQDLNQENPIFRKLSNGYYRIAKHALDENKKGNFAISLIPVKWTYSAALKHLKTQFEPTGKQIPSYIDFNDSPTDFPLLDREGNTICYLAKTEAIGEKSIADKSILSFLFLFNFIAFLLLAYVLNKVAMNLSTTRKAWVGASFLLFSVFGLRYLSILFGWTDRLAGLQLFQRTFSSTTFSIGDLLINIVLLLWVVIFFHRQSRSKAISTEQPIQVRFLLTILNYISLVLALLLLISVFKGLVLNSGVPFDFKNVFNLEFYSIVAVLGIILLLFTLFIFCHRYLS